MMTNSGGGKTLSTGPRLRDTKKAARNIGPPKKSGVLNSPKFKPTLLKENIHPSLSKVGLEAREKIRMEAARPCLENGEQEHLVNPPKDLGNVLQSPKTTTVKAVNSISTKGNGIDINSGEMQKSKEEAYAMETALVQIESMLSEQKVKPLSS